MEYLIRVEIFYKKVVSLSIALMAFSFANSQDIKSDVGNIYAFPMNTFTKVRVTGANIKEVAKYTSSITKANTVYFDIKKMLKDRDTIQKKQINTVRILMELNCNDGLHIVRIDKGETLCLDDYCYVYTKELSKYILKYFPKNKRVDYTPSGFE